MMPDQIEALRDWMTPGRALIPTFLRPAKRSTHNSKGAAEDFEEALLFHLVEHAPLGPFRAAHLRSPSRAGRQLP